METKRLLLVALVAGALLLTGCLGDGVSPEEVRDDFVGGEDNVTSYVYEGEITFETSAVNSPGVQTSTTTTEATIDYENRELVSELESVREAGPQTQESNTTTYLVNGTVYERTVSDISDSGWILINDTRGVERTWETRDELSLYFELLQNASVSKANDEQEQIEGAHALSIELTDEERTEFFAGKLGDQAEFFDDVEIENFSMAVWISEEENRLVRAETDASMIARNQETRQGQMDLEVDLTFVDEFSDYNQPVDIEIPDEARDAEPLSRDPIIENEEQTRETEG